MHDERTGCHRDVDGVLTLRTEVLTWRKEYKRHTEGDKVSIEGSAVGRDTQKCLSTAQRKLKKAIDTQKVKNESIGEKAAGCLSDTQRAEGSRLGELRLNVGGLVVSGFDDKTKKGKEVDLARGGCGGSGRRKREK